MTKEYKCLECVHLKPRHDLMECELQKVRYLKLDLSRWTYDPVCIYDDEVTSIKYYSPNYNPFLTNRFEQK